MLMTNKKFADKYRNFWQKKVDVILNNGEIITGVFYDEDEADNSIFVGQFNIYIKDIQEMKLSTK